MPPHVNARTTDVVEATIIVFPLVGSKQVERYNRKLGVCLRPVQAQHFFLEGATRNFQIEVRSRNDGGDSTNG